jgi:hypothetical protein
VSTGEVTEVHVHDVDGATEPAGSALAGRARDVLVVETDVELGGLDLDVRQGPPVHVSVSVDPQTILGAGPRSWALDSLPVRLDLRLGTPGSGVLTVDVIASTCEGDICTIKRSTREHSLTVS